MKASYEQGSLPSCKPMGRGTCASAQYTMGSCFASASRETTLYYCRRQRLNKCYLGLASELAFSLSSSLLIGTRAPGTFLQKPGGRGRAQRHVAASADSSSKNTKEWTHFLWAFPGSYSPHHSILQVEITSEWGTEMALEWRGRLDCSQGPYCFDSFLITS